MILMSVSSQTRFQGDSAEYEGTLLLSVSLLIFVLWPWGPSSGICNLGILDLKSVLYLGPQVLRVTVEAHFSGTFS